MSDQVAEIKSKINIVDVVGEYVSLKKAGRNFSGRCPFHEEKSPSFMVSAELQIYKCFGCGEAGDIYTFLQKQENIDFYEALQILAKRAGVVLETVNVKRDEDRESLKKANLEAARFYHFILTKQKRGSVALEYLLKTRNLKKSTLLDFKIGYAPEDSSLLFEYLKKKKGMSEKLLVDAGLVYKGKYGYMDRFRGRVIFPIHDHRGSIIGLSGRILPQLSDRGLAKYINSPETLIYHKSQSLYGIENAKNEMKNTSTAILVEGELDMISLWEAGYKNTVAIKGTAITEEQVALLSRFVQTLVFALDADFAGNNAAVRGITLAQNKNLEIKVLHITDYKDPDEFVKADPEAFAQALESAQNVWEFLIDTAQHQFNLDTGTGKSKAASFLLPFIAIIDDEVMKDHVLHMVAARLSTTVETLKNQIRKNNYQFEEKNPPTTKKIAPTVKSRRERLEEDIVKMGIMYFPEKLDNPDIVNALSSKFLQRIVKLVLTYRTQNEFSLKEFSTSLPKELEGVFQEFMIDFADIEHPDREFTKALFDLLLIDVKNELDALSTQIAKNELAGNEKELDQAEKKFLLLTQKRQRLEQMKNESII